VQPIVPVVCVCVCVWQEWAGKGLRVGGQGSAPHACRINEACSTLTHSRQFIAEFQLFPLAVDSCLTY